MEGAFRVASVLDPALDLLAMGENLRDYIQKRDESLIKTKPGQSPTWFHLRRIPTSVFMRYVSEATSDADRRRRAFQASVKEVTNLTTPEGETAFKWTPSGTIDSKGGPMPFVSDADLEAFFPSQVDEIGAIAEARSFLAQTSAPSYALPAMCLTALGQLLSRAVEQSASTLAETKPEAPEPQTVAPANNTAPPGAATATV